MKPKTAQKEVSGLVPCIHGGDVWEAANKTGLKWEEILDFSSSVNPLGPSSKAIEAMQNAFDQVPIYPDSNSTALQTAIAAHYRGISKENVVVGNGSTELIYLFADVFLKKGDVVLVPAPTFGEYSQAATRAKAKTEYVQLDQNFHIDPNRFTGSITDKVKAIFLCNPNNPTSVLSSQNTLIDIVESAFKKDILVFLDEDFLEFVDNGKDFSLVAKINAYPNLFVLKSFTKIFGLTGLRVGYGIASEKIVKALSNAKIPWSVNCLGQAAAVAALADEEHIRNTLALVALEKEFLKDELKSLKQFRVFPADANFLLIDVRNSGFTAAQLKEQMLNRGILIRDCSSFVGLDEYYIRISVKTRPENKKLLQCSREIVK